MSSEDVIAAIAHKPHERSTGGQSGVATHYPPPAALGLELEACPPRLSTPRIELRARRRVYHRWRPRASLPREAEDDSEEAVLEEALDCSWQRRPRARLLALSRLSLERRSNPRPAQHADRIQRKAGEWFATDWHERCARRYCMRRRRSCMRRHSRSRPIRRHLVGFLFDVSLE